MSHNSDILVYTDGSSLGNPGPGGYGVLSVNRRMDEVVELGGAKSLTTNNEMELTACVRALEKIISNRDHVTIYTDSKYVIQGITGWIHMWKKNDWMTKAKTPVVNRELWEKLDRALGQRKKQKFETQFIHVPGHAGIPGNERVNVIAQSFAEGKPVLLFHGVIQNYTDRNAIQPPESLQMQTRGSAKKVGKAFSYLSCVDGVIKRHMTWDECKKTVEGTKAHFRKSLSAEHEKEIIEEWKGKGYF